MTRSGLVRRLASGAGLALLATMIPAPAGLTAAAAPCAASNVSVARVSAPVLYVDLGENPQLSSAYAGYRITNNGPDIADAWVQFENFAGGVVGLAANEDGLFHVGPLAGGSTTLVFVYLTATSTTATSQTHDLVLYEGRPDVGGVAVCESGFGLTVSSTIAANANKVSTVVAGPNPAEIGGLMTMTVSGSTGQVGAAGIMAATPAAYGNWPATSYRLVDVSINLSQRGTLNDTLLVTGLAGTSQNYVITYTFVAAGTTSQPTGVSPISYIASGNQIKHTSTGNFLDLEPLAPPTNTLTLAKTVSPDSLPATGGTVTYTVTVTNAGTVDAALDDFADTLPSTPAAATYVDGSATYDGSPIADPAVAGATLTFVGVFDVAAGSTAELSYDVAIPGTAGDYANRVAGHVGSTQIDLTVDTGDDAPATTTVTVAGAATPSLTLAKSLLANADEDASGGVSVGDTLTYGFTATNDGETPVTSVSISDPLPGLSTLACTPTQPADLAVGETLDCTATYTVTQADVDAGEVVNEASVIGTAPDASPVTGSDGETVLITRVSSILVDKALTANADEDASGTISVGDTLTYSFVVTNNGNVNLDGVAVDDPLVGGAVTCPGTSLAPGATTTCTATYTVSQTDLDNGKIANTATVTATDSAGNTVSDTDTETIVPPQTPSITVDKTLASNADEDASGAVSAGDTLTYAFDVTNSGDVSLSGVTVSDPLAGLSTLACAPAQPATLAPGASISCTATYTVTQADVDAGSISNSATTQATTPLGATIDDSDAHVVSVPQNPSIDGQKSFGGFVVDTAPAGLSVGDEIQYDFEINNDGDVTLTIVTLSDPLPGLSAFQCGGVPLPTTLAPGQLLACTATYVVTQGDIDAGTILNMSAVSGTDPNGVVHTDTDTESVFPDRNPSIDLAKTLTGNDDADGSGDVSLGDTITYGFVATNDGDVTLDNVTISDPLAGLSPLSCVPANGSSLAPDASLTCSATYTVASADVDAGAVSNLGSVSADDTGPGGSSVGDTDGEIVSVAQNPSVRIVKSLAGNADEDGSGSVSAGDTLTYEFDVFNDGDVTLDNIVVSDPLVGGAVTCPQTTLAAGGAMACSATYVVTQGDIDAGAIDNVATVSGDLPGGGSVTDTGAESVVPPQAPSILVVKSLAGNADEDGDGTVSLNDTLTYEFAATNTGDVTLTAVTISDLLPGLGALTCAPSQPATLAPAASVTCTATYVVTQADVDAGFVANTATVTSERPGGSAGNPADDITDTDGELVTIPTTPGVSLEKSLLANADEDGSGDVSLGDTITYGFTVVNTGDVTLTSLAVDDPLTGPVTCSGAPLAPGDSEVCTADYVVTPDDVAAGEIVNSATTAAEAPGGDPGDPADDVIATDELTVPVAQNPAITLDKALLANADEDGSGEVSLGDTLTYGFTVTNVGDVALTAIAVDDPIANPVSCADTSLAPAASTTCSATYVVNQADVDRGEILNTATVRAEGPGGDPGDPADDVVDATSLVTSIAREDAIGLAKALTAVVNNGDGTYIVSFLFTLENFGNTTLTSLTITDDIPGQFSGMAATGFTASDGSLVANPAWDGSATSNVLAAGQTLAPGEQGTVAISFTVTPGTTSSVDNSAVGGATGREGDVSDVSTDGLDPDADGDGVPDDATPTPVDFVEEPGIGVAKELAAGPDSNGDGSFSLSFAIRVENVGDTVLNGIQVEDDLAVTFAGAQAWSVDAVTSTDFVVNAMYDGADETGLLLGTDSLPAGASGSITLELTVTPGDNLGPYQNSASGSGTSPSGDFVADLSQDGGDVDPDGNGDPGDDNDPTLVSFPGLGSVTGRVWLDADADETQDLAEAGIEGIRVRLIDPGPDGVVGGGDDTLISSTTTDADGNYVFSDVPAGDYVVAVATNTVPPNLVQTFDPDGTLDDATAITVTTGATTDDVDFGYTDDFDLVLAKEAGEQESDGTIVWTIRVTNEGPAVAPALITVTDTVPTTLEVLSVSAPSGWSCSTSGRNVACTTSADLVPGASATIRIDTEILGQKGDVITNSAEVESAGDERTTSNNEDSATITVAELPRTGADLSRIALVGLILLLAGAAIVRSSRSSRRPND